MAGNLLTCHLLSVSAILLSTTATAEVPQQERVAIDRIIRGRGSYAADDGCYKLVLPREAATIVQDYQTLSPNLGLNSWVAFTGGIHSEALLRGQFLLLNDEVASVLTAVLDAGLEVTGLASASIFDGPPLHTLDVTSKGPYQVLAVAFRKGLDAIGNVRRAATSTRLRMAQPPVPVESAIDGRPIDAVLSMKGSVIGGAYRAAIGKRALLHGEQVGREMGMSTWVSLAGSNDQALAHGEFAETPEDLQRVLKALLAKGIHIDEIRNHTAGEHPEFLFVRFWAQGTALELAKALRYVLDVEVGAATAPGGKA